MRTVRSVPHEPTRPAWRCPVCREEWPCRRRRALLRGQCQGSMIHLALLLAPYFAEATRDRPDIPPAVLGIRFLAWLRDPRPGRRR